MCFLAPAKMQMNMPCSVQKGGWACLLPIAPQAGSMRCMPAIGVRVDPVGQEAGHVTEQSVRT